ncbi:unnamed protein product [Meloidogyne enterolobii]|uniref:Uncharacterized protein n=1 Tax=Meloidogyne enterolobii TaxID=390850 RepID=A0ACB1APC2_MELEN
MYFPLNFIFKILFLQKILSISNFSLFLFHNFDIYIFSIFYTLFIHIHKPISKIPNPSIPSTFPTGQLRYKAPTLPTCFYFSPFSLFGFRLFSLFLFL